MNIRRRGLTLLELLVVIAIVAVALVLVLGAWKFLRPSPNPLSASRIQPAARTSIPSQGLGRGYSPLQPGIDTSGLYVITGMVPRWKPDASLKEISEVWRGVGYRAIEQIEERLADPTLPERERPLNIMLKISAFNYEGHPEKSYGLLKQLRSMVEQDERMAKAVLASVIYYQGVCAMRIGENDNCIMCRGESSCILPISPLAVHQNPTGSRLAIRHFTEYLDQFPDELDVRWLLNLGVHDPG